MTTKQLLDDIDAKAEHFGVPLKLRDEFKTWVVVLVMRERDRQFSEGMRRAIEAHEKSRQMIFGNNQKGGIECPVLSQKP